VLTLKHHGLRHVEYEEVTSGVRPVLKIAPFTVPYDVSRQDTWFGSRYTMVSAVIKTRTLLKRSEGIALPVESILLRSKGPLAFEDLLAHHLRQRKDHAP
jgi:hypothetical protein